MGITGRAVERFDIANCHHLESQTRTSDISATLSGLSTVLRMMLQSAVLGLGDYLAIKGELSPGAIIASSIVPARALAPADQVIAPRTGVVRATRRHSGVDRQSAADGNSVSVRGD